MKELQPVKSSEVISFSLATQECMDNITPIEQNENYCTALISESGKFVYLAKGGLLEMINLPSGKRISACNFNSLNCQRTITCFSLYQNKLLVGLKCQSALSSGILCVYDPGVSRVTAAISIPSSPSSVCVIKEGGGVFGDISFLSVSLKCFFGAAAVGTVDGHLYLTDLRSDETAELFSIAAPSSILVIDPAEIGNIVQLRDKARVADKHCAIDLAASMCSPKTFKYVSPSGKILKISSSENCAVTALEFVRQGIQLIVGFSFGCFQVWSLEHLQLLFSSDVGLNLSPVTHLVTQEPDDDPRHCFYLWVGRSPIQSQQSITSPTSLELFQMLYEKKETKNNYGVIYKNLECVMTRFEHKLTSDVHHLVDSRTPGSRIITLKSLEGDLSLCYVLWEAPTADGTLSCHLGVFDINRWYQKQLPPSIRQAMYGRMEPLCPFFIFYSMTDVAEKFLPVGLVDIFIDGCSWNNFRSVAGPQSEQFYWPSSSSFKAVCVSETGCIFAEMLGTQRQILADIHQMGTDTFLESQELVQSCWISGLLNNFDIRRPDNDKRNTEALLTLCLEHGDMSFITSCVKKWSYGSVTHTGYSIKLIYDWAWNQVVQHKKDLDELHAPLFCSLTEELEEENVCAMKKNSVELQYLVEIFKEIERAKALTLEEGEKELKTRIKIICYLSLYCDVLLLLIDSHILPELDQKKKKSPNKLSYPVEVLTDFYDARRTEISKKINSDVCLFIDLMFNCLETYENSSLDIHYDDEAKLTKYPPFSMEIMCSFFLQNLSEDELPLLLFYYWILDLCECTKELQVSKTSEKIRECFKLSQKSYLLVQSFWLLDHELYGEAMECLAQFNMSIPSVYYVHIIRLLYSQQEINLLVAFCSCKEPSGVLKLNDVKFIIKILLNLKMLPSAYMFQSLYSKHSIKEQVFNIFLEHCKFNGLLGKLIGLSLSPEEELLFQAYLESNQDNSNYLMIFYLERRMYSKAIELSKQFKNTNNVMLDHAIQDQINTRCLLVGGFVKMLPLSQQKKIYSSTSIKRRTNIFLNGPDGNYTPLSTVVQKSRMSYPSAELSLLYKKYQQSSKLESNSSGGFFSNQKRRKSTLFDSEVISPSKKPKDMPMPKFDQALISTISASARKHVYSGSDAYLLLKTPSARQYKKFSQSVATQNKTPQSILKPLSKTVLQSKETVSETSRKTLFKLPEQTPSRKIRFVGFNSPNTTSPLETTEETNKSHDIFDDSFCSSVKSSEIQVSSPTIQFNDEKEIEKELRGTEIHFEQKSDESINESFLSLDSSYSMSVNEILESLNSKKPEYKSDISLKIERLHQTEELQSPIALLNSETNKNEFFDYKNNSASIVVELQENSFNELAANSTELPTDVNRSSKEQSSDNIILLSSSDDETSKVEELTSIDDDFSADEIDKLSKCSDDGNQNVDNELDCYESTEEQGNMQDDSAESSDIEIHEESFVGENSILKKTPEREPLDADTSTYSNSNKESYEESFDVYDFKEKSQESESEENDDEITSNKDNESPKIVNRENVEENIEFFTSHNSVICKDTKDNFESSALNQTIEEDHCVKYKSLNKNDNFSVDQSYHGNKRELKELTHDNDFVSINRYSVEKALDESFKEKQTMVFSSGNLVEVNDVFLSASYEKENDESCKMVSSSENEHLNTNEGDILVADVQKQFHSDNSEDVAIGDSAYENFYIDPTDQILRDKIGFSDAKNLLSMMDRNEETSNACMQSPSALKCKQKVDKDINTPLRRSARKSAVQTKTQSETSVVKRNLNYSDEQLFNSSPISDVNHIVNNSIEQIPDKQKTNAVELTRLNSTEQVKRTRRTTGRRLKNEQYLPSNVEDEQKFLISDSDTKYKFVEKENNTKVEYVTLMQPLQITLVNDNRHDDETQIHNAEIQLVRNLSNQEKRKMSLNNNRAQTLSELKVDAIVKTPKKSSRSGDSAQKLNNTNEKNIKNSPSRARKKAPKDIEKAAEDNDDTNSNQGSEDVNELNQSMDTSRSRTSLWARNTTPSKILTRSRQKLETPSQEIVTIKTSMQTPDNINISSKNQHEERVSLRRYTRSSFGRDEQIKEPLLTMIETGSTPETTENKIKSRESKNADVSKNFILNFEIDKETKIHSVTPKRVSKKRAKLTEILPRRSLRSSSIKR